MGNPAVVKTFVQLYCGGRERNKGDVVSPASFRAGTRLYAVGKHAAPVLLRGGVVALGNHGEGECGPATCAALGGALQEHLLKATQFLRGAVADSIVLNADFFASRSLVSGVTVTAPVLRQQMHSLRSKEGFFWEELEWSAAMLLLGLQLPPLVFISGNTSVGLELHHHLSSDAAQALSRKLEKSSLQVNPEAILALPAEVGIVVCTVANGIMRETEHFEAGLRSVDDLSATACSSASSLKGASGSPAPAHAKNTATSIIGGSASEGAGSSSSSCCTSGSPAAAGGSLAAAATSTSTSTANANQRKRSRDPQQWESAGEELERCIAEVEAQLAQVAQEKVLRSERASPPSGQGGKGGSRYV